MNKNRAERPKIDTVMTKNNQILNLLPPTISETFMPMKELVNDSGTYSDANTVNLNRPRACACPRLASAMSALFHGNDHRAFTARM
jgi:hypothetical protein